MNEHRTLRKDARFNGLRLEEDPPGDRGVEHLGQGDLGLQDRDVVGKARGVVAVGERIGQDGQPLVQQRPDVLG